jgi:hypothetical protein
LTEQTRPSKDVLEVSFTLTADDMIALRQQPPLRADGKPVSQWRQWRPAIIIGIFFGLVCLLTLLDQLGKGRFDFEDFFNSGTGKLVLILVMLPFIMLIVRMNARRAIRRGWKEGKFGEVSGKLSISADGLQFTSGHSDVIHDWSAICHIASTPRHLFLYTRPVQAYVVPERAFASREDFEAFVDAAMRFHATE